MHGFIFINIKLDTYFSFDAYCWGICGSLLAFEIHVMLLFLCLIERQSYHEPVTHFDSQI